MNTNPLSRFFRQPAIYIRLPSQGKTWRAGTLEMPQNGEIPVYPMTMADEIMYRTPDALFNGEAVVTVIQSCIPAIRDAWAMPVTDIDAVLIAIRIATYGHGMDIGTQCPACNTEQDFELDLRGLLDNMGSGDYSKILQIGDLTVAFRPLSYQQVTASNHTQFEQQKTLQAMSEADVPEESRVAQINAMMKKIVDITVQALTESISTIRIPDAVVTDNAQIKEFLSNCDRQIFEKIRDFAISLREQSEMKPLKITCAHCQHHYEQMFTLDMARFFESAS